MINPSPEKVISVFKKHFRPIPLEIYFDTPFRTLVAVMLSARTRDEVTASVCKRLFSQASTPQQISKIGKWKLENLLHPLGFYKTKAKHLKASSNKLIQDFNSQVPKTLEELILLPGVGRKTANIILAKAFKIPAIGVDTHVHRIANTLGWVKIEAPRAKTPEKTEQELVKILPKKYWVEINSLFVSIGQQYRTKKALEHFLRNNDLI